jgi:hypothetical protein
MTHSGPRRPEEAFCSLTLMLSSFPVTFSYYPFFFLFLSFTPQLLFSPLPPYSILLFLISSYTSLVRSSSSSLPILRQLFPFSSSLNSAFLPFSLTFFHSFSFSSYSFISSFSISSPSLLSASVY